MGLQGKDQKYQRKKKEREYKQKTNITLTWLSFLKSLSDLVTTAVQKGSYFILFWCITLSLLVLGEQSSERNFLAVSKIKEPSLNSCDSCSCHTCYLWAFDNSLGVSENLWTAKASCFVTRRLSWFIPDSNLFVIPRTGQKIKIKWFQCVSNFEVLEFVPMFYYCLLNFFFFARKRHSVEITVFSLICLVRARYRYQFLPDFHTSAEPVFCISDKIPSH